MIPVLRVKDGVQFTTIAPAGFRLLGAFDKACVQLGFDLTITSACDGAHSGPDDPHHTGEAYDVRSKDIEDKDGVLLAVLNQFGHPVPETEGGYVTMHFFGWLENPGSRDPQKPEHFHFQRRKGVVYPPVRNSNIEDVQDAAAGER